MLAKANKKRKRDKNEELKADTMEGLVFDTPALTAVKKMWNQVKADIRK